MNKQAGLTHTETHSHTPINLFNHSNSNLSTRQTRCIDTSTTDKHSHWNHIRKSCAHINRNSTRYRRTDTDGRMTGRVCARVWETDKGRRTVRWRRRNPRMETKNTSVHVRHVKEDTSWHLMPGKKITLLLYASKYWHFSILLIRIIKINTQTVKQQTLQEHSRQDMQCQIK